MVNLQTLNKMSCTDITKVNKQQLKNVSKIKVDTSLPVQERLSDYLQRVENPYCFMVETSPVKISFSSNGKSLDDILINHMKNQKSP